MLLQAGYTQKLQALLERELAYTIDLAQLLQQEADILASRAPVEKLEELSRNKQDMVQSLEGIAQEREKLLKHAGIEGDFKQVISDLNNVRLTALWENLLEHATRCRELNQVNSLIINRNYENTLQALDILHGKTAGPALYTARGETTHHLTGTFQVQA